MQSAYVEVAVPVPLRTLYSYRVPPELASQVSLGSRVAVPFGRRKVAGVVVRSHSEKPEVNFKLRDVAGVLEAHPVFTAELLRFLVEAADYYLHPIGEVIRTAAPMMMSDSLRALKRSGFLTSTQELKGARISKKKLASADLFSVQETQAFAGPQSAPKLTPPQHRAFESIAKALRSRSHHGFLLHGVTGSGKTEVYLNAIEHARALDLGAIVIVPEIALTPQLVNIFRSRLGPNIAVMHSGLTDRDRLAAWQAIRAGDIRIVIGARSGIFAPVQDLGIVIVDEEHESSFKQEDGFRYHGRDMALLRSKLADAVCVLGSATPSVESYFATEHGALTRLELPDRVTSHALPKVDIVDLRRHKSGPSGHPLITVTLHRAIEACIAKKEQVILFLNRRGFAPSIQCDACGEVVECPACSVSLTEHKYQREFRCHYCDFKMAASPVCPSCKEEALEPLGHGTERIEDVLQVAFPAARVGRLDRDAVREDGGEKVMAAFKRGELDILVGTQMVTKGHDIPNVTLVGILLGEQSLGFPDFRAAERTFQLITQVAGRAGRGEQPGHVILQTFQPEHSVMTYAIEHDFVGFYRQEIVDRKELGFPPYGRLLAVRIDAADEPVASWAAATLAREASQAIKMLGDAPSKPRVLGPAPAPISRVRGRYRYRMLVLGANTEHLRVIATAVLERIEQGLKTARASLDVDPVSML